MTKRDIRSILISSVTVCVILGAAYIVIAFGRGYRLDVSKKAVNPTGLLVATSDPTGAQVAINGTVKSATNTTLNLQPDWYDVRIEKEGFQPWSKRLRVQGEIVSRADAYLFPTSPSLSALTTSGALNPTLSPDGTHLAYIVPLDQNVNDSFFSTKRAGIWILDLTDRPLGLNRDARQISTSTYVDFSKAAITWSPDSKQIVVSVQHPVTKLYNNYQFDIDKLTDPPLLVTDMTLLSKDWDDLKALKRKEQLTGFKLDVQNIATSSMTIISFSPDETKILYEASTSATIPMIIKPPLIGTNPTKETREIIKGNIYVYDAKEDKNYLIGDAKILGVEKDESAIKPAVLKTQNLLRVSPTPTPTPPTAISTTYISPTAIQWLPTNRHLILIGKDKIEVEEYDTLNRQTVYAGPFWDSFVVPWTNASKLLILTTLNPAASQVPNLYAVNLR